MKRKHIFDLLSVGTMGILWALYLKKQDEHWQAQGKDAYILCYGKQFASRIAAPVPMAERLFVCIVTAFALYLLFLGISFIYARTYEAFTGKRSHPLD